ncbi:MULTISPECIES: hypothetical protein [unclassified Brevundimonas]|uniref:hypothetical protein n=1 Tax=unclassified Brevundimonas TaxID=2622653 RepID=UPI00257AFB4C|nr:MULTISPECIES: hypothetical protein [unclassified Brevundimonas]
MSNSREPEEHQLTLEDIDVGVAAVEDIDSPDPHDLMERMAVEKAGLELKLARSRIKNVAADRRMRKTYAGRILRYLEVYSIVVAVLVVTSGFGLFGFDLPIEVLASLVGSTALAAIGLVGFIARGLFKPPPESSN